MNNDSINRGVTHVDSTFSADFCSRRLKALADPTRWAVMAQLLAGAKTVEEINTTLGIDSTLLSHHLRILREEGLVAGIREGKYIRYRLSPEIETPDRRGIDLGCCRLEMN